MNWTHQERVEAYIYGSGQAMDLAARCQEDAMLEDDPTWRAYYLCEAKRHRDRAAWWSERASMAISQMERAEEMAA